MLKERGVDPSFETGMRHAQSRMEQVRIEKKYHTVLDDIAGWISRRFGAGGNK